MKRQTLMLLVGATATVAAVTFVCMTRTTTTPTVGGAQPLLAQAPTASDSDPAVVLIAKKLRILEQVRDLLSRIRECSFGSRSSLVGQGPSLDEPTYLDDKQARDGVITISPDFTSELRAIDALKSQGLRDQVRLRLFVERLEGRIAELMFRGGILLYIQDDGDHDYGAGGLWNLWWSAHQESVVALGADLPLDGTGRIEHEYSEFVALREAVGELAALMGVE